MEQRAYIPCTWWILLNIHLKVCTDVFFITSISGRMSQIGKGSTFNFSNMIFFFNWQNMETVRNSAARKNRGIFSSLAWKSRWREQQPEPGENGTERETERYLEISATYVVGPHQTEMIS